MPRPRTDTSRDRGAAAQGAPPRICDFPGCDLSGDYRAPKSRRPETGHFWFCLSHVRDYNAAWDFFAGMNQQEIEAYQSGNATWHRPTWHIGGGRPGAGGNGREEMPTQGWYDPLDLMGEAGLAGETGFAAGASGTAQGRPLSPAERKALADLDLEGRVTAQQIKARYKQLVKRFHPDANGGSRSAEEKLKRINQAYSYLMSCGYS